MALNPLLSLIGRLVARSGRKRGNRQTDRQTDRQNDKTTTVTLAAHARRGLIMKSTKVQTLGARAVAGAWLAGWLVDWAIIIMAGHGNRGTGGYNY